MNYDFSIEYQELIQANPVLLRMNQVSIQDIYKQDTSTIARLSHSPETLSFISKPRFELVLALTDSLSQHLRILASVSETNNRSRLSNAVDNPLLGDGFLAIQVNRVRKIDFLLGIDKFEDEEYTSCEIHSQSGSTFVIEGILLEVHSLH